MRNGGVRTALCTLPQLDAVAGLTTLSPEGNTDGNGPTRGIGAGAAAVSGRSGYDSGGDGCGAVCSASAGGNRGGNGALASRSRWSSSSSRRRVALFLPVAALLVTVVAAAALLPSCCVALAAARQPGPSSSFSTPTGGSAAAGTAVSCGTVSVGGGAQGSDQLAHAPGVSEAAVDGDGGWSGGGMLAAAGLPSSDDPKDDLDRLQGGSDDDSSAAAAAAAAAGGATDGLRAWSQHLHKQQQQQPYQMAQLWTAVSPAASASPDPDVAAFMALFDGTDVDVSSPVLGTPSKAATSRQKQQQYNSTTPPPAGGTAGGTTDLYGQLMAGGPVLALALGGCGGPRPALSCRPSRQQGPAGTGEDVVAVGTEDGTDGGDGTSSTPAADRAGRRLASDGGGGRHSQPLHSAHVEQHQLLQPPAIYMPQDRPLRSSSKARRQGSPAGPRRMLLQEDVSQTASPSPSTDASPPPTLPPSSARPLTQCAVTLRYGANVGDPVDYGGGSAVPIFVAQWAALLSAPQVRAWPRVMVFLVPWAPQVRGAAPSAAISAMARKITLTFATCVPYFTFRIRCFARVKVRRLWCVHHILPCPHLPHVCPTCARAGAPLTTRTGLLLSRAYTYKCGCMNANCVVA